MGERVKAFDDWMFKVFNVKMKNKIFDRIMPLLTRLGSLPFIITLNLLLLIINNDKLRFLGVQMALTLLISQAITYIAKGTIKRTRPYDADEEINTYGMVLRDHSFPSGHSSASFTVGMVFAFNFPKFAVVFVLLAFSIALSRVYLGVHYGSDIVGGILLGVITSVLVNHYLLIYIDMIMNIIF